MNIYLSFIHIQSDCREHFTTTTSMGGGSKLKIFDSFNLSPSPELRKQICTLYSPDPKIKPNNINLHILTGPVQLKIIQRPYNVIVWTHPQHSWTCTRRSGESLLEQSEHILKGRLTNQFFKSIFPVMFLQLLKISIFLQLIIRCWLKLGMSSLAATGI